MLIGTSSAFIISASSFIISSVFLMVSGLAFKTAILSSLLVLLSTLSSIASISAIASSFNFFSAALKSLFAFCTLAILGSNSLFTSLSNEYFLLLLSALGLTIFSFSTGSVIASVAAAVSAGASTPFSKLVSAIS